MNDNNLLKLFIPFKQNFLKIYVYALVASLLSLSIPLSIQSIIGFAMGSSMVFSIYLLIFIVALSVALVGILYVKQLRETEYIQKKVFTDYSFVFSESIISANRNENPSYYIQKKMLKYFDIFNIQKSISKIYVDIPVAIIQILLGIILLTFYNSMFAFLGLSLFLFLYLFIKASGKEGIESNFEESNKKYEYGEWLLKSSSQHDEHSNETFTKEADEMVVNYLQKRNEHFEIVVFQIRVLIIFKVLITLMFLGYGTLLLVEQQLSFGEFVAVEIVIIMILSSVEKLVFTIRNFYETNTSFKKLQEVIEFKNKYSKHE
jgi:ABC-type bacteriocin/lantibiotic exporter with double-glycine peptidase domain